MSVYEPMAEEHIDALEAILRNEEVYRYIGGKPPTAENFRLGLRRALRGPPAERVGERWINFVVREAAAGAVLGRLEATLHDGIAEVAFLFGPGSWGKGHATEGLQWLHRYLECEPEHPSLWATTLPANLRSRALLERCGYVLHDPASAPRLYTYDDGDLVFFRGPA